MKHQSINTVDTQSSATHAIWVVDGERVFCRDGKPYAFYHTEISIDGLDSLDDGLDDTLGVVNYYILEMMADGYLPLIIKR